MTAPVASPAVASPWRAAAARATGRSTWPLRLSAALLVLAATVAGAETGVPIRLVSLEGDVAGMTSIFSVDGATMIGFVEYRQHRRGDILEIFRIARFKDGSSDEDTIEARVGESLTTIRGRSIIRNTKGTPTVDISIDVAAGRISGFSGLGKARENYDETVKLPAATYWGPMISILLKNFNENAVDDRLVFHTVVATPKPRVFDMELVRKEKSVQRRIGGSVDVVRFALTPTINFLVDPILRMFVPDTNFFLQAGQPPALARFQGPRNYAGQKIRIQ